MRRELVDFHHLSILDQGVMEEIGHLASLAFDDDELGSGGFGTVHRIIELNGAGRRDLLLKVFEKEEAQDHALETISFLHDKLRRHQRESGSSVYHEHPQTMGLPFMAFRAFDPVDRKECVAFVMFDLAKFGFEEFEQDGSGTTPLEEMADEDRFYLMHGMVQVVSFLHGLSFIHADISERNLWVNAGKPQLSLIDFDSGFHSDRQASATTIGALGRWISGRFRNLINDGAGAGELTPAERMQEEKWVIPNAMFEMLFGLSPYFFLNDSDDSTRKKYLKSNRWPNADRSDPLFNESNAQGHAEFLSVWRGLKEGPLVELAGMFERLFNAGYTRHRSRPELDQWMSTLHSLNEALDTRPVIEGFDSDRTEILSKDSAVKVNFKGRRFSRAYIANKLVPIGEEGVTLQLDDDTVVPLRLVNDFGEDSRELTIKAVKVDPVIEFFTSDESVRMSAEPVILSWKVRDADSVKIMPLGRTFGPEGKVEVSPTERIVYKLKAKGHFDQQVESEVTVDVVQPSIGDLTWEINLNHGVDNVDVKWSTENAVEASLDPIVGGVAVTGLAHVPLNEPTELTLTAKGLFGTTSKTVRAQPFPIPVVESILTPTPQLNLDLTIPTGRVEVPMTEWKPIELGGLDLNLDLGPLGVPSSLSETPVPPVVLDDLLPEFELSNSLIEKYNRETPTLRKLYDSLLRIIQNKLQRHDPIATITEDSE